MTEAAPEISPVMQQLASYMAGALAQPLPEAVVEKTKHHVLDTLAAMVSGSRLLPGRRAIAYAESLGGRKDACVVGSRLVTTAENAALANGMLAHADETDDSHPGSLSHPGCGVVPAALAMAEREQCDGEAFLRAVALGYDVGSRLSMALDPPQFRADGHSTHSFAPTFGAAAAAAALAGLDVDQMRHVLSYTAQQSSGVSCWARDTEHVEKAFDFGGMPARNGVTAASMVARGFTGVDDVFSGERNFFVAYGRAPRVDELVRELGSTYEVMNTEIKRWSVGMPIQAPLDALIETMRDHGILADDVERVTIRVDHSGANTVDNRTMPDICLQHLCAVMLLDGTVTFASSHDEARMRDPRVLAIRGRIDLVGDDGLTAELPARQGIAEVKLKDGRELRHHVKAVRGMTLNPMTRAEVDEKAMGLTAPILGPRRARALCDAVWSLDQMPNVRSLRPLLRA